MLQSLREEKEGKRQMLLSPRKNGLTSLFKEVRVFKEPKLYPLARDDRPLDPTQTGLCKFGRVWSALN